MKFIHAADLHVDSPLLGLEAYEGAPVERIRNATFDALGNLVRLAIDQRVDFVLIAGDLFDGDWRDMRTGLRTNEAFRRLAREGIRVFLIRGNHDAANRIGSALRWSDNVTEFSSDRPHTVRLDDLETAIHGWSFPRREVLDDQVGYYPEAVDGWFNIGLLHTSLQGSDAHDSYAPTTVETLSTRGYDYWALGHIHKKAVVAESPHVVFAGNTQGRHINESGEKGIYLVEVDGQTVQTVEFYPTDVLRWNRMEIELGHEADEEDLLTEVEDRMDRLIESGDDRFCAVRIAIRGRCRAHRKWVEPSGREDARIRIRDAANERRSQLWVEKIQFRTAPPIDLDELRQSEDLLGQLLRRIDDLGSPGREDDLFALAEGLGTLEKKGAAALKKAGVDLFDPKLLRGWLGDSQRILLSRWLEDA